MGRNLQGLTESLTKARNESVELAGALDEVNAFAREHEAGVVADSFGVNGLADQIRESLDMCFVFLVSIRNRIEVHHERSKKRKRR